MGLGEHARWLAKIKPRKPRRGWWDGPVHRVIENDTSAEKIVEDDESAEVIETTKGTPT